MRGALTRRHAAALALAVSTFALFRPSVLGTTAAQERIYVAVADREGQAVTDLTAADFSVAIDGTVQEIVSAAPATDPVSVVLLTDRLGLEPTYSSFRLHSVLSGFVKRIRAGAPGSRFALTTFDGPVVHLASFATPPANLDRMLGRLSTNAPEAAFLDAMADAAQTAGAAPTDRRVIFAVFAGYRPDLSTIFIDTAAAALLASKGSLWAIEVRASSGNSFGNAAREHLADRGSTLSGGLYEAVGSGVGLETVSRRMADLIVAQYVVTYAPGRGGLHSRRTVNVSRSGVQVMAPIWR